MRPDTIRQLLDVPAMTPLFAQIPALRGRNVERGELAALWVKPDRHFNASYRLNVSGAVAPTVLASAYVLEPERARRVISSIGPHADERNGKPCAHCKTLLVRPDLLLQVFPFDYRLPTLVACMDPHRMGGTGGCALPFTGCEPIGYRPGIRCQIRYRSVEGTHVYGKTAVERTPARSFELQRRVYAALRHAPRTFGVPEPLRYVPQLNLTLTAEVPGDSLYTLLKSDQLLGAVEIGTVAAALADFHRLDIDGVERVYAIKDEIELLQAWTSFVAKLVPDLAGVLNAAYDELVRTQPDRRGGEALVHRDFYDKQVLLSPHGLTFLDMDTVCMGDAEIDVGNFCAQLRLRGLQFNAQAKCARLEEAFLAAYPGDIATEKVAWYRRTSLLRLACGYALRPNWRHLAPALLEQVRG